MMQAAPPSITRRRGAGGKVPLVYPRGITYEIARLGTRAANTTANIRRVPPQTKRLRANRRVLRLEFLG